jgi:hypothetical protein
MNLSMILDYTNNLYNTSRWNDRKKGTKLVNDEQYSGQA